MNILEGLQKYCEDREFRLTVQNNKFHLLWVANDNVRTATFDDWAEVKKVVDIRNAK